jgi:hypothetical protein
MVTTALLSSMMIAGSWSGMDNSSWQMAMMKLTSLASVNIARASAWVEKVATAVCLTLRL